MEQIQNAKNRKNGKRRKKKTKIVKFGDKTGHEIISDKWKKSVKEKIEIIGSYDIYSKYYNFLNKTNINSLRDSEQLFTVNTYGKKMILFLFKFGNNKNYCIFINKKTGQMILSRFRFIDDLYSGTLLIGDFIKDNSSKSWLFMVDDIAYYKGKNIITNSLSDRLNILENLLKTEFNNDKNLSICNIKLKDYYKLNYIKSVYNEQKKIFNYKVSGLLFKNTENFSDNYLYTFIECRSDYKNKITQC